MKMFILAAGFGTRLYPKTKTCPKPLLPIAQKPFLTHLLAKLETIEAITGFWIITNQKHYSQFQTWAKSVSTQRPLSIIHNEIKEEKDKRGAIGDLNYLLDALGPSDENVAIIASDGLPLFDIAPFCKEFFLDPHPRLLVHSVPASEDTKQYNSVIRKPDGQIEAFYEKPVQRPSDLKALCFYLMPPTLGDDVRTYLERGGNSDAPGHFISWLCQQKVVMSSMFEGDWLDIGTPKTFELAQKALSENF